MTDDRVRDEADEHDDEDRKHDGRKHGSQMVLAAGGRDVIVTLPAVRLP
jgi:hypothetical protein